MSRLVLLLLTAATLATLACSGGDSAGATATASRTPARTVPLPTLAIATAAGTPGTAAPIADGALLLSAGELGGPWAEQRRDRPAAGPATSTGCNGPLTYMTRAREQADFNRTDRPVTLTHRVTAFVPGDAQRAMDDTKQVIQNCPTQKGTGQDGKPQTYQFKALPFPTLGDQTLAMRVEVLQDVSGSSGGIELTVVQVRRGDVITALLFSAAYGGTTADDMAQIEQFTRRADARLAANPAGPRP
ncbi:MAG: hypothetical protein HYX51_05245 [Chloroflexi bacterium]|nr:hypothetical protein [Chloroflexota bacterium]